MTVFLKKLRHGRIWKRVFVERLTEPLHLNLLSLPVYVFGTFRAKVAFDLVLRQHNAYAILKCADLASRQGLDTVTIIEFGVGSGVGLMNMAEIAGKVTRTTGVGFRIYGFDTGTGMPKPVDYRDHPDLYQRGDFSMDREVLQRALPDNVELILGDAADTVTGFLEGIAPRAPIGYVAFDLDYYSSTRAALQVFNGEPEQYLPITLAYFDDIHHEAHNRYCGELLAIEAFNSAEQYRKIETYRFLENNRIFKHANWIKHLFQLHVLDHPVRSGQAAIQAPKHLENPYLS